MSEPTTNQGRKRTPRTIEATRNVAVRDFLIFQLKLVMDGLKDVALFQISIAAIVLDLLRGSGKQPRLFYSVLRYSERFDLWLNLNGALEELEEGELNDDGLFGASRAGSDTLLGQLEQMVRGGDEPRGSRRRREAGAGAPPESDHGPSAGDRGEGSSNDGPGAASGTRDGPEHTPTEGTEGRPEARTGAGAIE